MDVYKTHGAFSWSELMTDDVDAAQRFYGALLGWKIDKMSMSEGDYLVLKVGDTPVGGLMTMPPQAKAAGMPPCWGCYVTVDDVDAAARRATELGGKIVHGPHDIPQVGRMVVIVDPQGAALSLITYEPKP